MRTVIALSVILILAFSMYTLSVDNPDAIDYVGNFQTQYERHMAEFSNKVTAREMVEKLKEIELFCDSELNKAYRLLRSELSQVNQEDLKRSQVKWIKFRDDEFNFQSNLFIYEKFGSFASVDIGLARVQIIQNRVVNLYGYLRKL